GVEVRPQHVNADVEIRMRIPLRARAELPVAVVRVAVRHVGDRTAEAGRSRHEAASTRTADDGLGVAVVVDLSVAAIHRGAPLRVPQMLVEAVDGERRGQLDIRAARAGAGIDAVRDPAEPGVVAGAVHLPRALARGDVADRAFRVGRLRAELIALEA